MKSKMFPYHYLALSEMIKNKESFNEYTIEVNGRSYELIDGLSKKIVVGPDYNFVFDKTDGNFARWGSKLEEDPMYSPIGGEILDIEITTICHGVGGKLCPFCYKSNTPNGKNMSFETFKSIIDKMGKQLTQVAFGADSKGTSNPDLWKMAEYCREIGIIPNITVAEISDEIADKLSKVMGAVAVSRYHDKNICYDSVKKLTDRGMKQVNIHYMISEETYEGCMETIHDIKNDPRLNGLNAIVLLSLKQKGRGQGYGQLSQEKYNTIVNYCLENEINFGMDSCGATKFMNAVKNHKNYDYFKTVCEPCESTSFSQYIDVNGDFYPCSFCEDIPDWEKGIAVKDCKNFLNEVWYHPQIVKFRNKLNSNCNNCHKTRECPVYTI